MGINNSVSDMVSVISESESYKAQINSSLSSCNNNAEICGSCSVLRRVRNVQLHCWQQLPPTALWRHHQCALAPLDYRHHQHLHPALRQRAVLGVVIGPHPVSHTPDRYSNPVPSSPNIPNRTLPHHEAVTTGTEDPVDDGVRRGSAASRDRAADAVALAPLGSQASASGPDMVSQSNDDSPHTEGDDANETFTSPQRRRSQREHLRQQADVILITDSTGKYVDSSRFMGWQNYTFHERASTSDTVLRNLNRCQQTIMWNLLFYIMASIMLEMEKRSQKL